MKHPTLSTAWLFLILSMGAPAQSGSSLISGVITDASGAVIPNAAIQIVNQETGVTVKTLSNEHGIYRAASLVPGTYRLEKRFFVTEHWKFDLRGEFYNLLNHAIFNVPGFTVGAPDFGVVSSARPPRTAQLAARLSF